MEELTPAAAAIDIRNRLRTSQAISLLMDKPPRLPMGRYWMVRLYVALSVITNCLVAWFEPASLTAQMLRANPTGWWLLSILCVLATVTLADIFINDWLPPQYSFPHAREHRHLVYIAIAIGTFCLTYAILKERGYTALLLTYWVDAGFAAGVAALDLFARRREFA